MPRCGKGAIEAFRGIEVGQVFKLGTKYSESMRCVFLDEAGVERPMVMGVLWRRHYPDDCGGRRAELRRRRHHLAVAGCAVSGASRQP